jgi:hypothetical protein
VLISKEEIKEYLNSIPPIPQSVNNCLKYLKQGELKKAALEAQKDIVLKKQIELVVNSAMFSLPNKVEDTVQLFTMIGLEMAKNLVYSYLVTLLKPKKWQIFNINFHDFQAAFMKMYEDFMIYEFGEKTYKKFSEIGAIVPISVCVCDSLFGKRKDDVDLILSSAPLDYATLLKRMTGLSLFGLAAKIAEIWDLEEEKTKILALAECQKCKEKVAALTHVLFFYLTSKKHFMDLNSLIEFNTNAINLIPKTYERIINDS